MRWGLGGGQSGRVGGRPGKISDKIPGIGDGDDYRSHVPVLYYTCNTYPVVT